VLKDDYVVVLIDPSADPGTIQLAVERVLQKAGSEATVRVIGPPEAAATAATRTVSPLVATAAVATVAAMGVGALVGGLAAVDHPKSGPRKPASVVGSGPATPLDTVDALRGLSNAVRTSGTPAVRLPVEAPDHPLRVLPVSFGKAAEAVSLSAAMPPVRHGHGRTASGSLDRESLVRGKHRAKGHHFGKGPPPWSRSAQRPPHPHEDRAR
jgi:hypothetical protein